MSPRRCPLAALPALIGALLLGLLSACRGASPSEPGEPVATYVLVALLRGDPGRELTDEEVRAASEGHFANMQRLSEEGVLLVAGPMADPENPVRGLFLLDCATLEEGRDHVATDPAVAAGLLEPRLTRFESSLALRELPELRAELEAEHLQRDPEHPTQGFVGREYVVATCNRGELAERRLAAEVARGSVLLHGRLGPPAESSALFVLDARSLEEAEALLRRARLLEGVGATWALDEWWATEAVSRLTGR